MVRSVISIGYFFYPSRKMTVSMTHIDIYSLALLLAIAVLSYLFGYLCGQRQIPPVQVLAASCRKKETPKDLS